LLSAGATLAILRELDVDGTRSVLVADAATFRRACFRRTVDGAVVLVHGNGNERG
jgi:hypothetical protein